MEAIPRAVSESPPPGGRSWRMRPAWIVGAFFLLALAVAGVLGIASFVVLPHPVLSVGLVAALFGGIVGLYRPYYPLLLLVFVIPFQFMTNLSGDGDITLPKLLMPVVVVLWVAHRLIHRDPRVVTAFFSHPFFIGVILFFLSVIPSYLNVRSPGLFYGFMITKMIPFFILAVLLADMMHTRERLRQFLFVSFLSAVIITVFGLVEIVTKESILSFVGMDYNLIGGAGGKLVSTKREVIDEMETAEWVRIASTFLDPNYFAAYLLLSLTSVVGYWLVFRERWLYFAVPAYAVMVAVCLFGTGSRGGFLGFAVTAGLALVSFKYPLKRFAITTVAVLALISMPFLNQVLSDSFRKGISLDAFYKDSRYGMWMTAKEMIREHPVVGVGFGNFTHRWNSFRHPRARVEPYLSHNLVIGVLAETGVFGLSFFFLALLLLAGSMLREWRLSQDDRRRAVIKLFGMGLIGFFAYALTSNAIDSENIWIILGAMVALLKMSDRAFGGDRLEDRTSAATI